MELATAQEENPCVNRGSGVVCPPMAPGTKSGGGVTLLPCEVAKRLWNMLQDVGVSWEWKDDANWQSVATEQEELAELMTAWPLLSPDLRVAILAIVRSADVMAEASCAATE